MISTSAIVADYNAGLTIVKIGQRHGCEPANIYYHLKKAGVSRRRRELAKFACDETLFSQKTEAGLYFLGLCAADGSIYPLTGIFEWGLGGTHNVRKFRTWLYQDATVFLPRKRDKFRY